MKQKLLFGQREESSVFWRAVGQLVGHVAGGFIMFAVIALASWGIGFAVSTLNALHPFPPDVLSFLHTLELWLLYLDAALLAIVVLFGVYHFIRELGGN